MNIVIVGGSLSGLLHAIICRHYGHKVHILERSSPSTLQSQAAGISVGPEVQKLINEYLKINYSYAKLSTQLEVLKAPQGDIINTIPLNNMQLTTWSILYRLLKSELLDGKDGLQQATYETSQRVRDVQYEGDSVLVTYSNTETGNSNSIEADLVIAADGGHSVIRTSLIPGVSAKYVGYVTWRGAVPEKIVSEASRKLLENKQIVFRTERGYTVSYHVPSETGSSDAGDCQFIWVWYEKIEEDSKEFREIFIDTSGKKYLTTIPRGKMQPSVWAKKRSCDTAALTKPFAELLEKTTDPFVSAIRESAASKAVFYGGKLILVGDAFALIRPHTGSSTNQAARQALGLAEVFKGVLDLSKWEKSSIEHAESTRAFSLSYAEYCFTGNVPSGLPIKPDNQAK